MTGRIGYYVHHHGDGHRHRAMAIASQFPDDFVLLGTRLAGRTDGLTSLDLPDDRPIDLDKDEDSIGGDMRPSALHYVPIDHDGIRRRVALIADWIMTEKPSLMIVDVSVEIAMLARLTSTPTVYVRLSGLRGDLPHLEAFRGARAIMAPFHRDLDTAMVDPWVREKTRYCPGLTVQRQAREICQDVVLVVVGKGGKPANGDVLAEAARATPKMIWRVIGPVSTPSDPPANLSILGWVDNADEEIAKAGVVVGAAGDGLVTSALAADRPLICLAEHRPFGEQVSKANRLAQLGAAISLETWPPGRQWPVLLDEARALAPEARARLHDPDGLTAAALFLRGCAARFDRSLTSRAGAVS